MDAKREAAERGRKLGVYVFEAEDALAKVWKKTDLGKYLKGHAAQGPRYGISREAWEAFHRDFEAEFLKAQLILVDVLAETDDENDRRPRFLENDRLGGTVLQKRAKDRDGVPLEVPLRFELKPRVLTEVQHEGKLKDFYLEIEIKIFENERHTTTINGAARVVIHASQAKRAMDFTPPAK